MRSIITPLLRRDKKIMLILFALLISSVSFAQFSTSCTSKDLELVGARIGDANSCVSCTPGAQVTKDLILSIDNKTGSFRPAFAYWGYLVQKDANGNQVGQPVLISDCSDAGLEANKITELTFPAELTYSCGNRLEIVNLVMAWTDAGKKSNCAALLADPDKINPKCGTVPVVPVNAGLNVAGTPTNGTCTGGVPTKGSINVTTSGGVPSYTFSWVGPGGFTASTEDISDLNAGLYTITVTDHNSTPCQKTATFNVTVPTGINASAVPTNGACVSGSPTAGSIALTVNTGTASSFAWTATTGGPIPAGQSDDEDLTDLPTGTYAVRVNSADGCYKDLSNISVSVPMGINASAVPTNGSCGTNGVPTNGSIALTVTLGTASSFLW
ncbi:MAG TPA: SprB repeat-containing protein, partial [Chitinophagaceae bacterium]|nr:SprB repeat-containing protein [Chitinophagaceae bacterium]